jgi:predicted NAD/FAD-dependent oxidoreductase
MIELDDWAAHMMRAEIQLKAIEHGLLHKDYTDIQARAKSAKHSIDKMLAWVARQGSSKGVDVVEILQSNVVALPDTSHAKHLLIASIQEIEQLRAERQFWLNSGFYIGKSDAIEK